MKLEYKVHNALNRLDLWRRESSLVVAFAIFADTADRLFSNEAGEVSSPYNAGQSHSE